MNKYNQVNQIQLDLYRTKDLGIEDKKVAYKDYLTGIRELAYKGHPEAQFDLAGHYEDIGFWGIPNPFYNVKKRFYWYSKAASNGHAEAHNNLAHLYELGEGCEKNISKALVLYEKSAQLGSPNGKKNLQLLKKQLNR